MTRLHAFRPHAILAGLLAIALLWAYALTQPQWWPQSDADRPVPVWIVDLKDIDRVEYNEGANRIVFRTDPAQRLQDGSSALWIEAEGPTAAIETSPPRPPGAPPARPTQPGRPGATKQPGSKAVPLGPRSSAPTAVAPVKSTPGTPASPAAASKPGPAALASFRGGLAASNVLRELTHLSGLRDLGHADAKQLQAFGLDKPLGTLRILKTPGGAEARVPLPLRADAPPDNTPRGEVLRLDLGLVSQGGATRYVALQPSGRVFLVPIGFFRQLEHVRRLMDHEWVPFNLMEAQRVEMRVGTRALTAFRLDLPPSQPQRWAFRRDATQGDPAAQTLIQTLSGMKVLDYLTLGAQSVRSDSAFEVTAYRAPGKAAPGAPTPSTVSDEPVTLRVLKAGGKTGTDVRAISDYTTVPVTLSDASVKAVLDRARPLLEGK